MRSSKYCCHLSGAKLWRRLIPHRLDRTQFSTAIKSSRQGAVADSRQHKCIVNTNALTAEIHQQGKSITSAGTDAPAQMRRANWALKVSQQVVTRLNVIDQTGWSETEKFPANNWSMLSAQDCASPERSSAVKAFSSSRECGSLTCVK